MSANTVEPNEKEELAASTSPPAASSRRLAEEVEDDDDLAIDSSKSDKDDEKDGHGSDDDDDEQKRQKRLDLKTVRSYASDTSATTGLSVPGAAKEKRPWYRNLNPLRWGAVPPVPTEREVSREYGAGFWSMITFQWMSPLMSVSLGCQHSPTELKGNEG